MEHRHGYRRRQDRFLAVLAHELRNPLAPIRTALDTLARAPQDPRAIRLVQAVIERQLAQLTRLVDDLYDFSCVSQGHLQLHLEPVDIADAVAAAVEAAQPLIEARRQELTVSLPRQIALVEGDLCRLIQVFSNVLNNAAKYTPHGGRIAVSVHCEGGWTAVRVRDSGAGIAPGMLDQVFEMFVQGETQPGERPQGLGIGLALARQLIEAHGGTIEAHSEGLGRGSEFVLCLPLLNGVDPGLRLPERTVDALHLS